MSPRWDDEGAAHLLPLPLDQHHDVTQQLVHLGLSRVLVHDAQSERPVLREEIVLLHLQLTATGTVTSIIVIYLMPLLGNQMLHRQVSIKM